VVPARGSQAFFAVAAQVIPVLLLALAIEASRDPISRALGVVCSDHAVRIAAPAL